MLTTQQHQLDTSKGHIFAKQWSPQPTSAAETQRSVPVILLHDSLGCVELWRDFPQNLAQKLGRTVIAYDRLGFGQSQQQQQPIGLDFIEQEAENFAQIKQALNIKKFIVFGYSVGGAMAFNIAAQDQDCLGLISMSAQAFVEDRTLTGVTSAQQHFNQPEPFARIEKYHGDKTAWVLSAWIDTWLNPAFSHWCLDDAIKQVQCPMLVIHGDKDEYGSLAFPNRIKQYAKAPCQTLILHDCGHMPQKEKPTEVLAAITTFLAT